jgi:hypothetical protein
MVKAPDRNGRYEQMANIAGYGWEIGGTKQVVYLTADGHIHELVVAVGGSWSHADLTTIARAPPAIARSFISGYSWEKGATKQVVFLTSDGHIHEIVVAVAGSWSHADLTTIARAPPAIPGSFISGYGWEKGGTKQVVYLTADGHIHELVVAVGGSWSHADLTTIAGAPPAVPGSSINGYGWEKGGTKQVVYLTRDGHIHELVVAVGGSWSHADLTTISGAPPATHAYLGYAWERGGTKQVAFEGDAPPTTPPSLNAPDIYELSVAAGGSWSHADLTKLAGAPQPFAGSFISGYGWEKGGTKQVVYLTRDGHIHELVVSVGGSWSDADLTKNTLAPPPISSVGFIAAYAWERGGTKQVAYLTGDGHIRELVVSVAGSWSHADLTSITPGRPPPADFPPPPRPPR